MMAVTEYELIAYLQEMMDEFKQEQEQFGNDRGTMRKLDAMIACKEMVETLIGQPVNLRKDGQVTVGF